MMKMSWSQVSARRLERHGLAAPAKDATAANVVAAMCGAHAQVMSAAELSIGLRLDGVTRTGVREALWGGRTLVKTHGPRGTVHLLPARDLPMWVGALSTLPGAYSVFAHDVRMTSAQTDQVVEAIREVLMTGAALTIDELSDAVVATTGPWAGDLVMPAFQTMWPRWRQAMATAAHRGAFVFGPARGRKVTYTAPPEGCRPVDEPSAEPANDHLVELVNAYLRAYGPATPEQFAKWIGAPVKWAAAGFAAAEPEQVLFDGVPAWVAAGDTEVPDEPPRGVRLLPYFDAYVVAGRPRELLYPGPAAGRALNGGQAGNFPVLLVDGQVAGVWHQRRSGRRLAVTVESLRELTPAQLRELDEQVALTGQILEGEPQLTLGPITVGGHA
ncbi:winged helix DNA-binding domain-containing protein [Nonomuraea sp. CA-143628]|uniref:winged helix DNA-binding domain-containing protein n=1 Tax=Nonomuraea sp. CA-143628 TaxID=3239997 RepID=UPI003D9147D4